ncbi:N-acetylmuramoyl-L-alanine amidase [Pontibacillus salicampi]|uniref:N-acetylmuramoyl-L-alanine amidase n=1 Tax=Pontibacillus salicampi TaxID=1449801 RepID=A0ABV6LU23_9BACI
MTPTYSGSGFLLDLSLRFFSQPYVALDIGHGRDTWENGGGKGVVVDGKVYEEHDANAETALMVKEILEAHGVRVWLPQEPWERDRDLLSRTNEANRRGVDLYWSFHYNAGIPDAQGACAFYWYTAGDAKKLAKRFGEYCRGAGVDTHGDGTHAGVPGTWTELHVNRETSMTAILTENGFMTNHEDFENIFGSNKKQYRKMMARINAKCILSFFGISYQGDTSDDPEVIKISNDFENKELVIHDKYASEGLAIYGEPVNLDNESQKVAHYIRNESNGFKTIYGKYDVDGYEMYKVANSAGTVRWVTAHNEYSYVKEKTKNVGLEEDEYMPKNVFIVNEFIDGAAIKKAMIRNSGNMVYRFTAEREDIKAEENIYVCGGGIDGLNLKKGKVVDLSGSSAEGTAKNIYKEFGY